MADVDCRIEGRLGRIHLNRPEALNALTRPIVQAVGAQLSAWKDDPAVTAVLVTGEGERAFCAGGDVRDMVRRGREEGVDAVMPFFHDEYRMNWRIKRFPKPYIAVLDGVTMGGGFGISVHGSHRLATESTVFAMPETAIGMFPDVGGTYVLGRMPGGLGLWLALTGHRLGPADTLAAGVATRFVPRARLSALEDQLRGAADEGAVAAALAAVAGEGGNGEGEGGNGDAGKGEIAAHRRVIDAVFDAPSVAAIGDRALNEPTGWGAEQWKRITARSPTSVKLAFAQLRRGRGLGFDEAMRLEYRIVRRILEGHDVYEGVRAVLIDKDHAPRWDPPTLEEVDDAAIEAHFAPLPAGDLPLDWR